MSASTTKKTAPASSTAKAPSAEEKMLPKSRIAKQIDNVMSRKSPKAAVASSALLTYIFSEILEAAAKHTEKEKRSTLNNRDIMMGIRNDVELDKLFRKCTFVHAGQVPYLHAKLVKKSRSKKSSEEGETKAPKAPKLIKQ